MTKRRLAAALAVLAGVHCAQGAQAESVGFTGRVDTRIETGYLSSSGTLIDTRPSLEHQLDLSLQLAKYGRLTACGWVISALHGGRDGDHRRAFYLYETTVGYGYDLSVAEKAELVNEWGVVWDSPWGYRHYSTEEVAWWCRHSLDNELVVPYLEAIRLFSPEHWLRIAVGIRRSFPVLERVSVTPFVESVWGNRDRYFVRYGETPSQNFLGGAFMTMTPGIRVDWRVAEDWWLWFRFREFITVDPQARKIVDRRTEYYERNEAEIFTCGVSYCF